jgi:tetratricopeptide (TPR) repeat protein
LINNLRYLKYIFIIPLIVSISLSQPVYNPDAEKLLDTGRNLFYASVEDKSKLDSAFMVFKQYAKSYPEFEGRATTYIGVLTALKGKHSFWVYTKYNLVKKGLKIMDSGIEKSPNDIEALFVYGSTCYYMPFLFGRHDEAQNAFNRIIKLLPENIHNYDAKLMGDVIDFLLDHTDLTDTQIKNLQRLKESIQIQ